MKNVNLTIDGNTFTVAEGTTILRAALDNDIYIPNLCSMPGDDVPEASCRLCWVEVSGKPVLSCTLTAVEGMAVNTKGERAATLARSAFELLMASHDIDCAHCTANGKCELQKIAGHLGVPLKPTHYRTFLKGLPPDESHPLLTYYPDRCVLCGRCVRVCRRQGNLPLLGYAGRGFERRITTFGDQSDYEACRDCSACADVCPTGALVLK